MAAGEHRLITIRFSHYNEKARWALDRLGVRYREDGYMPLLHFAPVVLATWRSPDASADHVSTRFSTPVLITEDGERICDSSRIVRWANEHYAKLEDNLIPDEECVSFDRRFSDGLGEHTRRLAYYWALPNSSETRALARRNVGPLQAALFSAPLPVGRKILRYRLSINDETAKQSLQFVRDEVAFANERIKGRRYLVGDRFTLADLTLACMLAPVLIVSHDEGYTAVLPTLEEARPDAAELARELRSTPAGEHVMRMFREERR